MREVFGEFFSCGEVWMRAGSLSTAIFGFMGDANLGASFRRQPPPPTGMRLSFMAGFSHGGVDIGCPTPKKSEGRNPKSVDFNREAEDRPQTRMEANKKADWPPAVRSERRASLGSSVAGQVIGFTPIRLDLARFTAPSTCHPPSSPRKWGGAIDVSCSKNQQHPLQR
jgi:hypothetical protein